MATQKSNMKELRVTISKEKYNWLREMGATAGFKSMSSSIRDLIDKHIFEQFYLKGNYGKENTKQIKGLLKIMKKKRPTIQGY